MSSVVETVALMIKAFPTLYPSRITALFELFNSSATTWQNGELVPDSFNMETYQRRVATPKLDAIKETMTTDEVITARSDNARYMFLYENAELLAVCDEYSGHNKFEFSPRDFEGVNLFNIPSDVKDDWKKAAEELARGIVWYKFEPNPIYSDSFNELNHQRFERSKAVARRYLDCLDPDKAKRIRDAEIAALQAQAAKLGLKIVEE